MHESTRMIAGEPAQAWLRMLASLWLMMIGSAGMYVVTVVLPAVQAEFGVSRSDASLPYTLTMIGFGLGGIAMGRLADRFGIVLPLTIGAVSLAAGFSLASMAPGLLAFSAIQGLLIGFLGCSATFGPLVADTSLWFTRRRGIAVAICASGNYLAGTVWPPITEAMIAAWGWRDAYRVIGLVSILAMLPVGALLRARAPALQPGAPVGASVQAGFSMSPNAATSLLAIAGVGCCVAMAMPQVHIVAYCGDLGYGAASGARMLSLMLAFGIVSRLVSGLVCDRIGGLRTLLLGASLQALALVLFLPFDGIVQLYLISALFGLFQGGIVPSYAIIVREHFPPAQAGARVGIVLMATLLGMALGGWASGRIFDLTGSYQAAFVHGIGWNLVNIAIVVFLMHRSRQGRAAAVVA
ncbi:MAG: MFS transporter [Burkholderiaceae bacterium]|nr:MFS transporter [Burkholderiaceae bacterium]